MDREQQNLKESYRYCSELTKNNSSFYLGILFNGQAKRKALYAIYAWMRFADDIADNEGMTIEARRNMLADFSIKTKQALAGRQPNYETDRLSFWPAFVHTVSIYELPSESFEQMIECQLQDLEQKTYQNVEELTQYCRLAASSVGQIFIRICGFDHEKAIELADKCGIAFQFTNIIRDVNEDLNIGRVYIPCELLNVSEITPETFYDLPDKDIHQAINTMINIAEQHYQTSYELTNFLKDGKLSFLILINYYHNILKKIRKSQPHHLSQKKTRLTRFEKMMVFVISIKELFSYFPGNQHV